MKRTAFGILLLAGAVALLAGGTTLAGEEVMLQPRDDRQTSRVDDRVHRSATEELVLIYYPERPMTRRLELRWVGFREVDLFLVWRFRTELRNLIFGG